MSAEIEDRASPVASPAVTGDRDSEGFPLTGHLQHLDLFRIVTFAAVVGVHTVANGSAGLGVPANTFEVVVHYTREAFFFLTGFVLAHSVRNRPLRLRRFWPKRFKLIGIPYLVWSFLYICYAHWRNGHMSGHTFVHLLWYTTLLGQASYHLYFLLVSMQIYLVFPLLNRLRSVGTRHPWPLLGGVAVLDAAILQFAHVSHRVGSPAAFVSTWAYITVLPYLFWIIGGSLAAWHLPRVQPWIWRHRRPVVLGSLATLALALGAYGYQVHTGWDAQDAGAVIQPVFLLWGSGAIALQGLLALAWLRRRRAASRATRAVVWGSSASFGVYLIHPILLDRAFAHGLSGSPKSYVGQPWTASLPRIGIGQPWSSMLAWAVALGLSCVLIGLIRHTPLSMPLTGREWGWRRRRNDRRPPPPHPAGGSPAEPVPTAHPTDRAHRGSEVEATDPRRDTG